MYINNRILIGKNNETEVNLLLNKANRHGLITGASGSGKTITLKVFAEGFSAAGVPVFLVDVKGDLAGMSFEGEMNDNIKGRVDALKLTDFKNEKYPTTYYDINGKLGHPIRTTVSSIGPRLLSRMLDLSDTQEEVLGVVFKISEDEKLELNDLDDLDTLLSYVDEHRKGFSTRYGNLTTVTITSIRRAIINLKGAGGDLFFGKPAFNIKDFIAFDDRGYGYINILDAQTLFQTPTTYVIMLLWLLTAIYNDMPEVGDLEKPKLVFFFDEAHLIFSEMNDNIVKQLTQIVKLIRSKGIGIYFISQAPSDITDEILSQLGNRVQHVLRAYTKSDEKSIKAAADGFRSNPDFDTEETIKMLGTGEALVSFQNEKGEPEIVQKVTILPPQSRMGTITDQERDTLIKQSRLQGRYDTLINDDSALEKINKMRDEEAKVLEQEAAEQEQAKELAKEKKSTKKEKSFGEKMGTRVTNKVIDKATTKVINKIFNKLFK